jgi:hypothetical protein
VHRELHGALPRLLRPGGVYSYFNGLAADNASFHRVYCELAARELAALGFTTQFVPLPVAAAVAAEVRGAPLTLNCCQAGAKAWYPQTRRTTAAAHWKWPASTWCGERCAVPAEAAHGWFWCSAACPCGGKLFVSHRDWACLQVFLIHVQVWEGVRNRYWRLDTYMLPVCHLEEAE